MPDDRGLEHALALFAGQDALLEIIDPARHELQVDPWSAATIAGIHASLEEFADAVARLRAGAIDVTPRFAPDLEPRLRELVRRTASWAAGSRPSDAVMAAALDCQERIFEAPVVEPSRSGFGRTLAELVGDHPSGNPIAEHVRAHGDDERVAWERCDNGGWLAWIGVARGVDPRLIALGACDCVRAAIAASGADREVVEIVVLAERCVRGEATADACRRSWIERERAERQAIGTRDESGSGVPRNLARARSGARHAAMGALRLAWTVARLVPHVGARASQSCLFPDATIASTLARDAHAVIALAARSQIWLRHSEPADAADAGEAAVLQRLADVMRARTGLAYV